MKLDRKNDTSRPLINPDDFKSIRFHTQLSNSATNRDPESKETVEVLEIGAQTLTVEASDKLCALGHHMQLEIIAINGGNIRFTSTARVSALDPQEPNRARIELVLLQYDKTVWAKLRSLMLDRQGEITDFLRTARGY